MLERVKREPAHIRGEEKRGGWLREEIGTTECAAVAPLSRAFAFEAPAGGV